MDATPPRKGISAGLKQALPDEPPLRNPTGTGENSATGMGHELVQHVKLCQLAENLDEASAKGALITYEQQLGAVLHTPAPGRPALNGEINPIVVGVGPSQNLCALVVRRSGETDMRALRNYEIAVIFGSSQGRRVKLVIATERRAGILVAGQRSALETPAA